MDPISIIIGLVLMTASYLITASAMKGQKVKPATLEEFDFPQVDEGTPQAVLFGMAWQKGWVPLWYGELVTRKIKSEGGKK